MPFYADSVGISLDFGTELIYKDFEEEFKRASQGSDTERR